MSVYSSTRISSFIAEWVGGRAPVAGTSCCRAWVHSRRCGRGAASNPRATRRTTEDFARGLPYYLQSTAACGRSTMTAWACLSTICRRARPFSRGQVSSTPPSSGFFVAAIGGYHAITQTILDRRLAAVGCVCGKPAVPFRLWVSPRSWRPNAGQRLLLDHTAPALDDGATVVSLSSRL